MAANSKTPAATKEAAPKKKGLSFLKSGQASWNLMLVALIVLEFVIFGAANPKFLKPQLLLTSIDDSMSVMIISLFVTFVMITGGIDIQVASLVGLTSIIIGVTWQDFGFSILQSCLLAIVVAAACGALSGFFIGMCALFYAAAYTTITPGTGAGQEMNGITGVIIGGTSMSGGSGTMVGTLIGVFIMSVLKTGLANCGLQAPWQTFLTGAVVIGAVLLDIARTKAANRVKKG
jgi:ribose/xylose/arabinose/galactoside ABC-type transport system permease subunit